MSNRKKGSEPTVSKVYRRVSTKGINDNDEARAESAAIRALWHTHVRGCLRRDVENGITISKYSEISRQPCYWCGSSPTNMTKFKGVKPVAYNGVDRMDNQQGYTIENLVPCCKWCNAMKSSIEAGMFLSQIHKISHYWHMKEGE